MQQVKGKGTMGERCERGELSHLYSLTDPVIALLFKVLLWVLHCLGIPPLSAYVVRPDSLKRFAKPI
jgi:hypothetical protein